MNFLESHAHQEAQYVKRRPRINQAVDEIVDQPSAATDASDGASGNATDLQMMGTTHKKQSISAIFGLTPATNFGLQSVTQQLEIWEDSMKGFIECESFMMKFPYSSAAGGQRDVDQRRAGIGAPDQMRGSTGGGVGAAAGSQRASEPDQNELYDKFKEYAKKRDMQYQCFPDGKHLNVVTDRKHEKALRIFTQDLQFQGRM